MKFNIFRLSVCIQECTLLWNYVCFLNTLNCFLSNLNVIAARGEAELGLFLFSI